MTDCRYCHLPVLDGKDLNTTGEHDVCVLEWNKRFDDNMCVTCRKNNPNEDVFRCSNCMLHDYDFMGYEGPQ